MTIKLADKRILVTGGAGFIGSHIVERLLSSHDNVQVRILDNLSTGRMTNIQPLLDAYDNHRVEFVLGDITDLECCRAACKGMDMICHQAAIGSVYFSVVNPLGSHAANVNGFLNIMVAAKEAGIRRVVYASSCSVYGTSDAACHAEQNVGQQMSPYAVTKQVDELYGQVFSRVYGMEAIGLRYFNVFGPRQDPDGVYSAVIPKFTKQMLMNQRCWINGDGSFSRDFVYVDDVVYANILALTCDNPRAYGSHFNVGTGVATTIGEIFSQIKRCIPEYTLEAEMRAVQIGDVAHSRADISKIQSILAYEPRVDFSQGLKATVGYFRRQLLATGS